MKIVLTHRPPKWITGPGLSSETQKSFWTLADETTGSIDVTAANTLDFKWDTDSSSSINTINDAAVSYFEKKFSSDLVDEIVRNGVEAGIASAADDLLARATAENRLAAGAALNKLYLKNFSRPSVAAALVVLASRLPARELDSVGLTIATSACFHPSAEVAEAGIMALESWRLPESQTILKAIQPTVAWLRRYRDAVLADWNGA